MDKLGKIEIHVSGKKGSLSLSPENYDVKETITLLQNIEDLLYPANKKDRPIIAYHIENGSVKHIFTTGMQAVIGFSAILTQIQKSQSIDFLELKTAQAIENIQNFSYQKNYSFEINTSVNENHILKINPDSQFLRSKNIWAESELYFYGTLTNAGGKNKANIHIDTEEFGSITIDTDKDFLKDQEENLLYKKYGIRAKGKQNIETGEIDKSALKLIQLIDFSPIYKEGYLNKLIRKSKYNWKGINPDEWLNQIRGGYDA